MKLTVTNNQLYSFGEWLGKVKQGIANKEITTSKMFTFFVSTLVSRIKDDMVNLQETMSYENESYDEFKHKLGLIQSEYKSAYEKLEVKAINQEIEDDFISKGQALEDEYRDVLDAVKKHNTEVSELMGSEVEVDLPQVSFKILPDDITEYGTILLQLFKESEEEIFEMVG